MCTFVYSGIKISIIYTYYIAIKPVSSGMIDALYSHDLHPCITLFSHDLHPRITLSSYDALPFRL